MTKSSFTKSSIGRKLLMALSGLFLVVFLLQHASINMLSVFSPDAFNDVAHFMGTNWLIQYIMQPVLAFGVMFHLIMGIYLEIKNRSARPTKYASNKPGANSSFPSRSMIYTGLTILLFLGLHFYDFWFPELGVKFVQGDMSGLIDINDPESGYRYYEELRHKFVDIWRVALYVVSFIFLALHLLHGFQSAFQSVGFNHNRYTPLVKRAGTIYAIVVPAAFIFIALYHFITCVAHS
jgi:succinate dehydrogenase / fumarate reductase cytochrome b subunit